jgi:hypothetical protein
MADYKIGYGKPPEGGMFKVGRSGNPRGRPKPKPDPLGEIVDGVLSAPVRYRENGRTKTATRRVVRLKLLVERAIKGDLGAAELLLKKRTHALRNGQVGAEEVLIVDWLPDYPGQTGEQKAKDVAAVQVQDPAREG